MSAFSHHEIVRLILSFAKVQWRKVAMIISQVLDDYRQRGVEVEDGVAERICALVENGPLEAQGNLSRWRHSEVKLPG
jgi:Protein of unknown function